ncbi:hypothetical protein P8452_30298 [Trifolium repens]|nr:hypothetical protein P8452_30298 [Trifolium repens]
MAEKLVKEMSLNGLCPDLITYMTMIEGLCNVGRLEDAYSMLKVMKGHGCSPNSVVLSSILDGLCRSGSMERASELLDEMQKGGDCCPNVVTYTSLIQVFCKRGQWTEAMNVLDRMRAFGCFANHVTVFTLIESLCTEGRVEEVDKLVDKFVVEHCVSREQVNHGLISDLPLSNPNIEYLYKLNCTNDADNLPESYSICWIVLDIMIKKHIIPAVQVHQIANNFLKIFQFFPRPQNERCGFPRVPHR